MKAAYLKRIQARLKEGFSAMDLCRCVDAALQNEFYLENGYYKQPEVLWRNAERVQSLLRKAPQPRARQAEAALPPQEVAAAEKQRDEWLAKFRAGRP